MLLRLRLQDIVLSLNSFLLMASYAFASNSIQSLFLEAYSSRTLAWAWLGVAVTAVVVTSCLSQAAVWFLPYQLFLLSNAVTFAFLVLLTVLYQLHISGSIFLLYIWKDIYVIVLVEQFWTLVNTSYTSSEAKVSYGWFCAAGSLGSILGSVMLSFMARYLRTVNVLWLCAATLVLLDILMRLGKKSVQNSKTNATSARLQQNSLKTKESAFKVVFQSAYLGYLLMLVAIVQIIMTVVDFQFSHTLQQNYPNTDVRTGVLGNLNAVINIASLISQVSTQLIFSRLGLENVLLILPGIMSTALVVVLIYPGFLSIAMVKVLSKCIDYSWFRCAKEMLYLPLSYSEKTQGKALIDVMTFRVAKGLSALLVLLAASWLVHWLWPLEDMLLCLLWLGLTVPMIGRYRRILSK